LAIIDVLSRSSSERGCTLATDLLFLLAAMR
jgi:hypothetical protein